MLRPRAAALLLVGSALAGCGSSGSSPAARSAARTPPDLEGFLHLPVATPSVCTSENAATYGGRTSPWAGHVDISVFLRSRASASDVRRIGRELRNTPISERVYFESGQEAYAEFQRLYTCWGDVPRSQTPASYRIMLEPRATIRQRDALVGRMARDEGVDSVSCDPALPCTEVVQTAAAHRR